MRPLNQNHYCATISSSTSTASGGLYLTPEECDYAAYYNPYVEVMNNLPPRPLKIDNANNSLLLKSHAPNALNYEANNYYMPLNDTSTTIDNKILALPNPNPLNSAHFQQQQEQQHSPVQQPKPTRLAYQEMPQQQQQSHNMEAIYGTYTPPSFRTSSSDRAGAGSAGGNGIYAQPKIINNNMSSFRSSSPAQPTLAANGHLHQATPKANPNLIAQLNARLNSKQQQQQQQQNESIYNPNNFVNHKTPEHNEHIYMRANYAQQQQQQQQQQQLQKQHHHQQQQQQQSHYDGNLHTDKQNTKIYGSFSTSQSAVNIISSTSATSLSNTSHNLAPHFPLSSSTSSLLSKVTSFSTATSMSTLNSPKHLKDTSIYKQSQQQQQPQQQQFYSCPPPVEDPPPPPQYYAAATSATLPKNTHCRTVTDASVGGGHNLAMYAASMNTATMPRNYQPHTNPQQTINRTQHYQQQQQQQQQNHGANQQRPPMPLPHHQQQQQQVAQVQKQTSRSSHKTSSNSSTSSSMLQQQLQQQHHRHQQQQQQQQHQLKQPPVPKRHSSVQQKIYVATNPFVQTTTIHCHSPKQPSASPTCSSPSNTSVYGHGGIIACDASNNGAGHHHHHREHHNYYNNNNNNNNNNNASPCASTSSSPNPTLVYNSSERIRHSTLY